MIRKGDMAPDFTLKGNDDKVADTYGVYHADKGITGRVTVLVGPDGRVADVMEYDFPTVPETAPVLQALSAL